MLRETVNRVLRRSGYRIIRTRPLGHDLPSHLGVLLPALGVNLVLDVGANVGQTGQLLRKIGYSGLIISFEPGPASETLFKVSRGDPRWWVRAVAVGEEDDVVLNVTASDVFASVYEPNSLAREKFESETRVVKKTHVKMVRLDGMKAPVVRPRIFLKTDTQGNDLGVVAGAAGILPDVVAILLEAPMVALYDETPDAPTILRTLNEQGFRLLRSFPNNEHHGLDGYDQDWVFIRNR